MTDLRARQKALARRTIAEAAGRLSAERPHLDFSMQEVADRAGVSLRTVYNHFESREALFEGLVELVNDVFVEAGGLLIGDIERIDDLVDGVRVNFPIFEQLGPLLGAADSLDAPAAVRDDHAERTRRVVELTTESIPELTGEVALQVGLAVRHMVSHRTWVTMTTDHGLTTDQSSAVARWAIRVLLDAARRGDVAELQTGAKGDEG